MKTTDHFKNVIKNYLDIRASYDELFAHSYRNPDKSIDQCVTYILNEVKKSGCCGFSDDEIFSYALHYFDETDIEVGNPIDCQVVVNRTIELTEEEKEQVRKDAVKRFENDAYAKMKQPSQRATAKKTEVKSQATLFDF